MTYASRKFVSYEITISIRLEQLNVEYGKYIKVSFVLFWRTNEQKNQ
jgi:hypothetical protein